MILEEWGQNQCLSTMPYATIPERGSLSGGTYSVLTHNPTSNNQDFIHS